MSGTDYTLTANLGLFKPNYDMDDGQWGFHLNGNADVLDSAIHALQTTSAGVTSWNARTGAVVLNAADVTTALAYTPYNATNPSGYQTAAQVTTALAPYAPLLSPALTGNPTAPTPSPNDNDTSIATTAFVLGQASGAVPTMDGTAAAGVATMFSRGDHTHPSDTSRLAATGGAITGNLTVSGTVTATGNGSFAGQVMSPLGITYAGHSNAISFSWASPNITAFVDNASQGILATQAFVSGAYLPLTGGTVSGGLNVSGTLMTTGAFFASGGTNTNAVSGWGVRYYGLPSGTTTHGFQWNSPNAGVINGYVDGGSVIQGFQPVSDERLKSDIAPTSFDGLAAVLAMPLFEYRWKDHSEPGKPVDDPAALLEPIGFVAQRAAETFPSAVMMPAEEKEDQMILATLNPLVLLAAAYDAIKRLTARVEVLEAGNIPATEA
jgi:hypothetical protein